MIDLGWMLRNAYQKAHDAKILAELERSLEVNGDASSGGRLPA